MMHSGVTARTIVMTEVTKMSRGPDVAQIYARLQVGMVGRQKGNLIEII